MWLAIYVPGLALQAFSNPLHKSAPVVVFDRNGRRDVVISCNRLAMQLGVKLHMSLSEANALSDRLVVLHRESERETQCLEQLADALSALTPSIHISKGFGLLLEVSGSLTLFGGADTLLQRTFTLIESRGLRAHVVLAPTSRGARWLAKAYRQLIVESSISDWLDDLSLACTDLSDELITSLRELNLHHLAALRRLPSIELNNRFGTGLSAALDQAYGKTAQSQSVVAATVLPYWQAAPAFRQYVEFLELVREQTHWQHGIVVLLRQLQEFVRLRSQVVISLQFCFSNGNQQTTGLVLVSRHGSHRADDWMRLFLARLEQCPIEHEISRIDLHCDEFKAVEAHELDFFDSHSTCQLIWQSLLDLLISRLGMHRLRLIPRRQQNALPESQSLSTPEKNRSKNEALRPAWLIDPPRLLHGTALQRLRQSLSLYQPERIEAHWSAQSETEGETLRDYYIAAAAHHSYWWVFRERKTDRWFLQGIFA